MRKLIFLSLFLSLNLIAKVEILTTYAYIADVTEKVGGNLVKVSYLAKPKYDPHFITAKPSFIAKIKKADLVIENGADLEIGWFPKLLSSANNSNLKKERVLTLSNYIEFIEIPDDLSRSNGDIHPDGNPHFHLNPDNILIIAKVIKDKLIEIDSQNSQIYKRNFNRFKADFLIKIEQWEERLKSLQGVKVYQYHSIFSYFLKKFKMESIANLEPLSGIPPTMKHIKSLIDLSKKEKINYILQDVYHSKKSANFISKKSGIEVLTLPHDVKSTTEAKDIFLLFETIVKEFER